MEPICIRFSEFGIPQNVLRVENKKIESPRRGEVLVRMIVRPINPSDLIPITGAYSHRITLPGIAIDSVGGLYGTDLAFCIRPNGTFLTIGLLSGKPVNWAEIKHKAKVNVKMFHLRHWIQQVSVQAWQETFNHLVSIINDKRLRLRMPEAVRVTESFGSNKGKFFLTK